MDAPEIRQECNKNICKGKGASAAPTGAVIYPMWEVKRFVFDCVVNAGTPHVQAEAVADTIAEADYRGHYSHGMNRLEMYLEDIAQNVLDPCAEPVIISERPGTALVDGQNGWGMYVSRFCMDLAIKKAKEVGIGIVSCRGSNHFGVASMYSLQAARQGMIGMSFTNTSPFMCPTRSKKSALGTNPLAVAAPGENGEMFDLDMATTTAAIGKIEMAKRKNQPIREGWAQGTDGNLVTDPVIALSSPALLPLGGVEANSGFKGYGLGLLVEVLSGVLAGACSGPDVRLWSQRTGPWNLGHCFIAIDVASFEPGFEARLSDLMSKLHNLPPVDPELPVLVPGDPERAHMKAVDKAGGVQYVPDQLESCKKLAAKYNVKEMVPLSK